MKPIEKEHQTNVRNSGDDKQNGFKNGIPEAGDDTKKEMTDPIVKK